MYFVICIQKGISFKIYFKFNLLLCTNLLAHLCSAKAFSKLPCSTPLREQSTTKNGHIAYFLQYFHPILQFYFFQILLFFFCLPFILLPIWESYGTTNSSVFPFWSPCSHTLLISRWVNFNYSVVQWFSRHWKIKKISLASFQIEYCCLAFKSIWRSYIYI